MSKPTQQFGLLKSYSKRKFVGSFKVDPELWSSFKAECRFRGVQICYVLEALMVAWMAGQKAEATVIKPVVVNLTMEHIVQRPRRIQKLAVDPDAEVTVEYIERFGSCYRLRPGGQFPGRIGFCGWLKRWIHGHECPGCIHSRERY